MTSARMSRRKGRSRRRRRRHGLPAIPRGYSYRRLTIGNRTIEEILPIGLHPRVRGRVLLEDLTEDDVRRLREAEGNGHDRIDLPILVGYDASRRVGTARVSRAAFPTVDHVLALAYRVDEVQEERVTAFEPIALGLIPQVELAPPGLERS